MSLLLVKEIPKILSCKYALFYLCFIVLFQMSSAFAFEKSQVVELSSLGAFELKFSTVKKANLMVGQNLIGEVSYKPGENYAVVLPFDVQKVIYHAENGRYVNQGETIASVEGFDVHHYIDAFESAKKILEISASHFETNKQYFDNKTLKTAQWLEITKNYYDAKLNLEHFEHQMSFVRISKDNKISLISPKKGILKTPNFQHIKSKGDLVFDVINLKSIKVKITTPLLYNGGISHFVVSPTCQLKLTSIENIADKYHQILWASPTSEHCNLTLGQSVKVTPILSFDGYEIPKAAIFEFNEQNYIAIKLENNVSLVAINIIAANNNAYYATSKENIVNKQVLISSVSILQGKLLKLGAE
ncbi:hypothetical protein H4J59_18425 [Colwellia sp. MB02u-10]|uniref:hypothetical protein n=1 Tax=Colwellia sp. MB02u-10 TaxID=2759828 RepID=UPI0015F72F05|nr:hypothetical protein [Colwellia sp. MB02u-10]MBA6342967.1 hypothetical protein [Colwellia sp. MB02u-10]